MEDRFGIQLTGMADMSPDSDIPCNLEVSEPEVDCELGANLCLGSCSCSQACLQTLTTAQKTKPLP